MDIWTFNADDDDDDELILDSDSDAGNQPAHKFPAAKKARIKLGQHGSRPISLLDDIDDLDDERKPAPELERNYETFGCRTDARPQLEVAALTHKVTSAIPARPRRLDPALQAEAMRAKANLERIRRQAEEAAAASASEEDDDDEVVITSTATNAAEESVVVEEQKVMLRIKSARDQEGKKMRIGVGQPLSRLFEAYQQAGHKEGWLDLGAAVIFKWDGEKLGGKETPAGLDLEEDDVIDAVW